MKLWSMLLAALFALTLSACSPSEPEAPSAADTVVPEQVAPEADIDTDTQAATEAEPASSEPGGYEPTPEERVPPAEEELGS